MRPHSASTIALAIALIGSVACSGASSMTGLSQTDPTLASGPGSTGTAGTAVRDDRSGSGSGSNNNTDRIRLIASLTPPADGAFRRASGKAKWDSRNNDSQRELEMEVEDLAQGTEVNFFVAGTQYGGTVTVDAFGEAHLELSTQLGNTVPTAAAGLTAEVRTTAGVVIVTGIFP